MGISRNLNQGIFKKAVFLDRDGVLNPTWEKDIYQNPESPLRFEDFKIFSFVPKAIKKINSLGYLAIVVTNQPAYAKGKMAASDLKRMHELLIGEVSKAGGKIEKIYACLHHPDPKQVKIKHLLANCECRKPKPGMILSASLEFNINLRQSWMIGDTWKDIDAGRAAGCKTILISENLQDFSMIKSDAGAPNLIEALKIIEMTERR